MNSSLPHAYFFWPLLALCAIGFTLLYAVVVDAGRGARRRMLMRRLEALKPPSEPADPMAVERLREGMALAQQALRHASRAHGHAQVPLPWFMFLGDGASNMPGLLAAAHGERPAADAEAADIAADDDALLAPPFWRWWVSPAMVAIEIDASVLSDADAAPRARGLWLQALLALAERRHRLPLNGLVLCIGAAELLQADQGARLQSLATRMGRLADETRKTLRLHLPVYLVVTGLEQLGGYATLRGSLPPEVLAQALGHRLPEEPTAREASATERFDALFDALMLRLHALRMALLREQPSASGRLAVHEFVEAVRALEPGLRRMVEAFSQRSGAPQGKQARGLRWRGFYLTAASGAGRGAFVGDLFERFLPADQPLVRPGRVSGADGDDV